MALAKTVVPAANFLNLESTPFVLSGSNGTGGRIVFVGVVGSDNSPEELSVSCLVGVMKISLSEEDSSWTDSGY